MAEPAPIAIEQILQTLFAEHDPSDPRPRPDLVGQRTRLVAEVRNVYRDDPTAAISVFAVRREDPRAALLGAGFLLRFDVEPDRGLAFHLERRTRIDVVARIDECAEGVLVLSECRFATPPAVDLDPAESVEPPAS